MASPERSENPAQPTKKADITAELAVIHQQLETIDEMENPIERFNTQNTFLERYDDLQAQLDMMAAP